MGLEWILRMSRRACSFGSSISNDRVGYFQSFTPCVEGNYRHLTHPTQTVLRILRSSLPGRSRAGSRVSGLFVAMIILTLWRVSKPSIWFSSWQGESRTTISHSSFKSASHEAPLSSKRMSSRFPQLVGHSCADWVAAIREATPAPFIISPQFYCYITLLQKSSQSTVVDYLIIDFSPRLVVRLHQWGTAHVVIVIWTYL